jgi:hypothetical protein
MQRRWKILLVTAVLLLAVNVIFLGTRRQISASQDAATTLSFTGRGPAVQCVVDFGRVYSGQKVGASIRLANGTGTGVNLKCATSCGCTRGTLRPGVLAAGEASEVLVEFDTFKKPFVLGKIEEQFVVADVGKSDNPLVVGKVVAEIIPSIAFELRQVLWDYYVDGKGPAQGPVKLGLRNATGAGVKIRWTRPSNPGVSFDVTPAEIDLAAGEAGHVTISCPKPQSAEEAPLVVYAEFVADVRNADGSSIATLHRIPLRLQPLRHLTAIPGALSYSPDELVKKSTKSFKLNASPRDAVRIESIGSEMFTVAKDAESNYTVAIRDPEAPPSSLFQSIDICYEAEGIRSVLKIPVILPSQQGESSAKVKATAG